MKKLWELYQKMIDVVTRYMALISGTVLFVMMILVTIYILMRKLIGPGNFDAIEISGYMMAFVVFGALSRTFRDDGLLRVELVYDRFQGKVKKVMDVLLGAVGIIYCSILIKYCCDLVINSYVNAVRSVSTYRVLLYIPQSVLILGSVLLFLTVLEYEIKKIIVLLAKETTQTDREEGEA